MDLAEATRNLVHELFNDYGLVIIDGDHPKLKKLFSKVMEKEIKEQFSYAAVSATNEQLKKDGGKIQITARPINLFYILDGVRERIKFEDDVYTIDNVGSYSQAELLEELDLYPERFSPNVVLRPLYQEIILPNLSYTGGVGEISYWLQLKGVFNAVDVTYPMICVRNSMMWVDRGISKKMNKIDMVLEDAFKSTDLIKREFIEQHSSGELNFDTLDDATANLGRLINESVLNVDATRQQYADAEVARLEKQLNAIKAKMVKHSKAKHEEAMKIIDLVKSKLFPGDSLQERSSNFFSFCNDGDYKSKLETLYNSINTSENNFIVIREA